MPAIRTSKKQGAVSREDFMYRRTIATGAALALLVAVPAYFTIVVLTLSTGVQAQDFWFPITVVVTILAIPISFVYTK